MSNPFPRRAPLTEGLHSTNPFPDLQHRSSFRAVPLTAPRQSRQKPIVHNVLSSPMPSCLQLVKKLFPLYSEQDLRNQPKRLSVCWVRRYSLGFTSSLVPLPKVSLFAFPEFTQSNPPLQKPPCSSAHLSLQGRRLCLSSTENSV